MGIAYPEGLFGRQLLVSLILPDGEVRMLDRVARTRSEYMHTPPDPTAIGIIVGEYNDCLIVRLHDADINRSSEEWIRYDLRTEGTVWRKRPKGSTDFVHRLRSLEDARFVVGTNLIIVQWSTRRGDTSHFELLDSDDLHPYWHKELGAGSRILETATPGFFVLQQEAGSIVRYEVLSPGAVLEGEPLVREDTATAAAEDKPSPSAWSAPPTPTVGVSLPATEETHLTQKNPSIVCDPGATFIHSSGAVYVQCRTTGIVYCFSANGDLLTEFHPGPHDLDEIMVSARLAVSSRGDLYVPRGRAGGHILFRSDGTRVGPVDFDSRDIAFLPQKLDYCVRKGNKLSFTSWDTGLAYREIDRAPSGRWIQGLRNFALDVDGSLALLMHIDGVNYLCIYASDGSPEIEIEIPFQASNLALGRDWVATTYSNQIALFRRDSGKGIRLNLPSTAARPLHRIGFDEDGHLHAIESPGLVMRTLQPLP